MEEKICTKCGISKPISEFYKDKQKPTGYRPDCKSCNKKQCANWAKNNKERHYGYDIKRKYGINLAQYKQLLESQKNRCAICGKHEYEFKTRFHVDHSHQTGEVRALLCVNCNHGVGAFFEDTKLLQKALNYIKKHGTKNSAHK